MGDRCLVACLAVSVVALLFPLPVTGQESQLRTSWGDPNLEGVWTGSTLTPVERPLELAGKNLLTEEEVAALEREADQDRLVERAPRDNDPGTYNQIWFDPGTRVVGDRRTSLIVDPPDGRIPYLPEMRERQRLQSEYRVAGQRNSWVDVDTGERCMTDGLPMLWLGLQSESSNRADTRPRGDPSRNVPRPPNYPSQWATTCRCPTVEWRHTGLVGERHTGGRDDKFRRQDPLPMGKCVAYADRNDEGCRTLHTHRRKDARLRTDDRGPSEIHTAMDHLESVDNRSGVAWRDTGTVVRIRLSRRQLQSTERAQRSPCRRETDLGFEIRNSKSKRLDS